MGLHSVRRRVPARADAQAAKNYLDKNELYILHIISEQILLFAQSAAMRDQQLTMRQLAEKFDTLLETAEYPIFPGYKEALWVRAMDAQRELERYKRRMSESESLLHSN
jgi:hypothetical protein